jgi:hypothetical protein
MSLLKAPWCVLAALAAGLLPARAADPTRETVRYVRPSGDKFVRECEFVIARDDAGWAITSVTERGALRMEVVSRYDAADRPLSAKAVLTSGGRAQAATVEVKNGKATIRREGQAPLELDAPPGTIITSAPDWTDVFLLCGRYDRQRKGKQEFPALWIHPTQAPQRLTFSIEWQGAERIERDGAQAELGRYAVRIRNGSAYVAWADAQGRLVRLLPLPWQAAAPGLTRESFEKAAAGLRPAP